MKAGKFIINQMLDSRAMNNIKHELMEQQGIIAVRMDMNANTITIDYDEDDYNSEQLKSLINQHGIDVKGIM